MPFHLAVGAAQFEWSAHRWLPFLGLLLLLVVAAGPLGYVFFRDWRLKRGYKHYVEKDLIKPIPESHLTDRPPLISGTLRQKQGDDRTGTVERTQAQPGLSQNEAEPSPGGSPSRQSGPPSQTGTVVIYASDERAEIFVDGMFFGNAPARVPLAAGTHDIEMRMGERELYQRKFFIKPGDELTIRASFDA